MRNSKEVVIISNYYFPEMGAAPGRITSLAEAFKESGYKVRVICPLPNYPEGRIFQGYRSKLKVKEVIDGIQIDRLWIYPSKSKNSLLRMLSMISFALSILLFLPFAKTRSVSWFVVQSPPLFVSFFSVFAVKQLLRKRVCLNVSDLWPGSAVELGVLKKGKLYKLLCRMESYIYKKSDLISGQSQEIIDHVRGFTTRPCFVYRNIPKGDTDFVNSLPAKGRKKVVYAGLLGFAQGVYKICSEIDFLSLGLEFHIYGNGMEREEIETFIEQNKGKGVFYHGTFKKEDAAMVLGSYDAALVPLTVRIHGAVPSKIFELTNLGVPILFAGGGEGATIVETMGLGLTCTPGDIKAIERMLIDFDNLSEADYSTIKENLLDASANTFNYQEQFANFLNFMETKYE